MSMSEPLSAQYVSQPMSPSARIKKLSLTSHLAATGVSIHNRKAPRIEEVSSCRNEDLHKIAIDETHRILSEYGITWIRGSNNWLLKADGVEEEVLGWNRLKSVIRREIKNGSTVLAKKPNSLLEFVINVALEAHAIVQEEDLLRALKTANGTID